MVVSGSRCEFTLVVVRLAGRWAEKLLGFYPVMGLGIKVTPELLAQLLITAFAGYS